MVQAKTIDFFAGVAVSNFASGRTWYERLLCSPPAFFPHATEAVWEIAEHRYLYIVEQPQHAGHAMHTIFVDGLDAVVSEIANQGLEPAKREQYPNGVR